MLFSVHGFMSLAPKHKGSVVPSCHWLLFRPENGSQNTQLRFCLHVRFIISRLHSTINTLSHDVEVAYERITSDTKYSS